MSIPPEVIARMSMPEEKTMQSIAKYDVYGDMRVPFDIGTWLRAHKFNPTAVSITLALSRCDDLTKRIAELEEQRDSAEEKLRTLCAEARVKMGHADAKR